MRFVDTWKSHIHHESITIVVITRQDCKQGNTLRCFEQSEWNFSRNELESNLRAKPTKPTRVLVELDFQVKYECNRCDDFEWILTACFNDFQQTACFHDYERLCAYGIWLFIDVGHSGEFDCWSVTLTLKAHLFRSDRHCLAYDGIRFVSQLSWHWLFRRIIDEFQRLNNDRALNVL